MFSTDYRIVLGPCNEIILTIQEPANFTGLDIALAATRAH
jgi:hypothetical protein